MPSNSQFTRERLVARRLCGSLRCFCEGTQKVTQPNCSSNGESDPPPLFARNSITTFCLGKACGLYFLEDAAVKSAAINRIQNSVNLALGSAIASIGLTIPAVAAASFWLGTPLVLGLSSAGTVLLVLTLYISALSLVTGRTTIMQGGIHLVIFGVFLLITAVP